MTDTVTPEDFARLAGVSRETLERLRIFADLLLRWQRRVNLIGRGTADDLWRRHVLDSAQLHPLLPSGAERIVDIGSGAGFPGLVLAILGVPDVHLIEANARKCAFLREAARVTATPITIHNARVETLKPWPVDVVTARAVAPLPVLLDLVEGFLMPNTICLFPKGRGVDRELTEAEKKWNMIVEKFPSRSGSSGTVVRMMSLSRVDS